MSDIEDTIDSRRLIIPGLAGLYKKFAPFSHAFMRFSTGLVLFPHGVQKVFTGSVASFADNIGKQGLPMPTFLAYATFFSEFVASACLMLGLFTRVAAIIVWIQMAVIITVFQWHFGYFWTNRGYEYALLWWLLCTAIIFRGGGRYSLDHLIGKEF